MTSVSSMPPQKTSFEETTTSFRHTMTETEEMIFILAKPVESIAVAMNLMSRWRHEP
jgi:hypothetical protein